MAENKDIQGAIPGSSRSAPEARSGLRPSGDDPARDLYAAYQCVGEALEYFDSHRLATWAPVASLFVRERRRGRLEGLSNAPRLFAALDLAANRLLACAVDAAGSRESYEYSQWAREAREAAESLRDSDTRRMAEPVPVSERSSGSAGLKGIAENPPPSSAKVRRG